MKEQLNPAQPEELEMSQTLSVSVMATLELGSGNDGSIGPDQLHPNVAKAVIDDIANPEYVAPSTNKWICVDGRVTPEARREDEAAHQIAGGRSFTDAMARIMQDEDSSATYGQAITTATQKAVEAGKEVYVHGDDGGRAGCGANKLAVSTAVLTNNVRNAAVVGETVIATCRALGIDEQLLADEDITRLITNGADRAHDQSFWDVTPEEAIAVAIAAGAKYEQYTGKHLEADIRADISPNAFNKAAFVEDHKLDQGEGQAFSASFGAYKADIYEQVAAEGGTEKEAALLVAAALLYNVGVCKALNNNSTKISVVG